MRKVLESFVKKNVELTDVLSKLNRVVQDLTEENKSQQTQLHQLVLKHQVRTGSPEPLNHCQHIMVVLDSLQPHNTY